MHINEVLAKLTYKTQEIKNFIYNVILDCELHEMNEFLKFDGVHYHDPHPSSKKLPI